MDWWNNPEQELIDQTLDERIGQLEMAQREIFPLRNILAETDEEWWYEPCPGDIIIDYNDAKLAHAHIQIDIGILLPKSAIPF